MMPSQIRTLPVDELEAAVTAFNEANKSIHVYQSDYSKAILIQKREEKHEPQAS